MAERVSRKCLPDHIEYGSQMLAENAVTLHEMSCPEACDIEWFDCGDHFHIGHHTPAGANRCKELTDFQLGRMAEKRGWNKGRWASR